MTTMTRPGARWAVLLLFAAVSLSINFLHTETGPVGRPDCPACHFLTSSLSTSPGVVFHLPALLCQGTLAAAEPYVSAEVFISRLCSRSPPQV